MSSLEYNTVEIFVIIVTQSTMMTGVLIELADLPFYTDYSKHSTMYSKLCTVYTYQCTLYTLILHYITPTALQ